MAELSDREAVRRLFDRLGFGPRPGELDVGFDQALSRLLDESGATGPAPPKLVDPPRPEKDDRAAKKQANKERSGQEQRLRTWWLDRMVATDAPNAERMTWFWHGHFATSEQKVRSPRLMLEQNETFRDLGRGGFGELAHAMIVDPAMLLWLDGKDNKVGAANENLAREFLELFALGHGHYTEHDVRESARALTGWTVKRDGGGAKLRARRHDDEPKTLFGRTANYDEKSFVDAALARPESAAFVVGRLWYRLVSATPPPQDVLDSLVDAYGGGRDIRAVLRAIAGTPAFRDPATTMVKQPVEWLVGLLRATGVRPSNLPEKVNTKLNAGLRGMGQIPLRPPSVGGWPSGLAWLTTAAGVARLRAAGVVAQHAELDALRGKDIAGAVGELLGVSSWSERTAAALSKVDGPRKVLAIAACAPEYVVSR